MDKFGNWVIPITIFLIILFGIIRKAPLFDCFVDGAKEGLNATLSVLPSLIGLILAVSMLNASGAFDIFSAFIAPVANLLGIPKEVMPLALLRPISGSGSLAILTQIFQEYGPDSFIGRVASVMMGSTETTFYAITIYFGAIGIKKTRHAIPAALSADLAGYLFSVWTVRYFFG